MNIKIDLEQIEGISAATVSNWNQAYQWGAHSNMGYLTAVPLATVSTIGGGKLFSNTVQNIAANNITSTASRTYGVQLNSIGQLVVNVPWVDTNTNTVTQIGVNGGSYTSGNINFIGGQDIQISKNGNNVRIDYVGSGGLISKIVHDNTVAGSQYIAVIKNRMQVFIVAGAGMNLTLETLGEGFEDGAELTISSGDEGLALKLSVTIYWLTGGTSYGGTSLKLYPFQTMVLVYSENNGVYFGRVFTNVIYP